LRRLGRVAPDSCGTESSRHSVAGQISTSLSTVELFIPLLPCHPFVPTTTLPRAAGLVITRGPGPLREAAVWRRPLVSRAVTLLYRDVVRECRWRTET